MVSRRALLGAGALLLVGCGPPDEPEVNAANVWRDQLLASMRAEVAYPEIALRSAARDRVRQLEAAAGGAIAASVFVPPQAPGQTREEQRKRQLESALDGERRALQAHVAAVGVLEDRASRELLGTLIAGTAEAVSALRAELDEPPIVDAFPGQRNRP
ncbi:hypothetical protein OJ997_08120 [Solirubrobacter phytolaccae]|uniref:Uncharacterized protein n=1 Tax=Solirubrobacter phytolaccae TaxID=1404360 RepID=A0A9X3SEA8_9ACTN|nr:hypothetical protein [Solirubrobacter phytolaccae]MDA0180257.1 hypothetical protein [Solirubrobacter phytolaccae]